MLHPSGTPVFLGGGSFAFNSFCVVVFRLFCSLLLFLLPFNLYHSGTAVFCFCFVLFWFSFIPLV